MEDLTDHKTKTKATNEQDHGRLDTEDGLSKQDHDRGFHYYGGYKVMHKCQKCQQKRQKFGYDYGWHNVFKCNSCV